MHAAGEFLRQCGVDHAMAFDSALSLEGVRHDINPEMRLATGLAPSMAGVLMGFVLDIQPDRRERRSQSIGYAIAGIHAMRIAPVTRLGQCGGERGDRRNARFAKVKT